ncbi:UNVERIFIED_CONTAM: hypothetical protein K2H54_064183 [Gekko kuhli]
MAGDSGAALLHAGIVGGPRGQRVLSSWPGLLPIISPWCWSRLWEEEELQELNDRLASYIKSVRGQEVGRADLKLHLARQEEEEGSGGRCQESLLWQHYEGKLAEVHRLLDDEAANRITLQLELSALRDQHHQLHDSSIWAQQWRWQQKGGWLQRPPNLQAPPGVVE